MPPSGSLTQPAAKSAPHGTAHPQPGPTHPEAAPRPRHHGGGSAPPRGPAQAEVPAQLSPELLFPHGQGRRVFRRGGAGREATGLGLHLALLLCVPHASLCPALPCSVLLPSSPLPSPGGLSERRRCRCVISRAAAPGSSRDGAQPCGQRRSRRCRFQENGRLFPAEQVRRSGAERVTLSSLTPWQRGHGVSICHPFGCCWGGRAEDRLGTALPEGCAPFLL